MAYALSNDGAPDIRDSWAGDATRSEDLVAQALGLAASGESARLGRMLGPMSVRYIVVPLRAGPQASGMPAYPPPPALLNTLAGQLDLRQQDIDDALVVYENEAWIPERARLSSRWRRPATEPGSNRWYGPTWRGRRRRCPTATAPTWQGNVNPGTLFLSAPADTGWHLSVDGTTIDRRPARLGQRLRRRQDRGRPLGFDTPLTRPLLGRPAGPLVVADDRRGRGPAAPAADQGERQRHPAAHQIEEPTVVIEMTDLPVAQPWARSMRRLALVAVAPSSSSWA